ncbi:hypothetical protein G6M14_05600 [Agrobacterium tumefaciens]|uniref:hypothetical protein n=1 Tax=Agrobacterium tumefaciens TaxID=358 RepID=UPI001571C9DD|nr:hypothetical protein [Agrobacterium tumefaciens]
MQTQLDESIYLTCHGVPAKGTPPANPYFLLDPQGYWTLSTGNWLHEIDECCVGIHDALAARIFGSMEIYFGLLRYAPDWIYTAGLDSESALGKQDFEKLVQGSPSQELHKLLYLFDCRKLVSGIQETILEVVYFQGEFYRTLNLEDLFSPPSVIPDGLRHSSSPVTAKIISFINVIYIRLHSLLDYLVKLAFEVEHLRDNFQQYPRLASRSKLYGDRGKISWNKKQGTLFEDTDIMAEIETIRNLVIHDGILDQRPKVYESREGGVVVERYLLLPDRVEGRLVSSRNRNLFYSGEDKINLRLPEMLMEFQARTLASVSEILAVLQT